MKILLATDGTKCSDEAVKMISRFTFSEQDSLKIISVIYMALPISIDIYGGFLPPNVELEKAVKENADKILSETSEKLKSFLPINPGQISTEVLFGSPESRIVETAEEIKADIIVVGSHGYNSWERLLLGSVSDSVVHHAPCSVLVVRKSKN
jgi:nucleotide-binding universal stress UspA family protein